MSAHDRVDEPTRRALSDRAVSQLTDGRCGSTAGALPANAAELQLVVRQGDDLAAHSADYEALYLASDASCLSRHPAWLSILQQALGHSPYCIEARTHGQLRAILPMVLIRGPLFGSFLVSLPYLNTGGVICSRACSDSDRDVCRRLLIDQAVKQADQLNVRFLEIRNEKAQLHASLTKSNSSKVHMRLPLTPTVDELWRSFSPKVRNQIRKGQKGGLTVQWGGLELSRDFYAVFSRNMRDLGTPVYGIHLFEQIVSRFSDEAEFCVVRSGRESLAVAILLHGLGVTEVPSASSLRAYNSTNANMLMYFHLLQRSIGRSQRLFDFGRSSPGSGTYRFKQQWGAQPAGAVWQYYIRRGAPGDMRPENAKYRRLIRVWQHLPVSLTRLIGPAIVRGIP